MAHFHSRKPHDDSLVLRALVLTLTLLRAAGDSHLSDAGYQALADVVFDASGYSRVPESRGGGESSFLGVSRTREER